jgi:hypothetical protein
MNKLPSLSQYLVSLSLSLGAMGLMAGYWVKLLIIKKLARSLAKQPPVEFPF